VQVATAFAEDQIDSEHANQIISMSEPYRLRASIVGVAPILFHAWNIEAVEEKANAKKGSDAKKTDNVESYVYRTDDGHIGIPGVAFAACIREAGRYEKDPRSPRKSAMDLIRAGVVPLDIVAPLDPLTKEWDFEHRARVTVQRAAITRTRPAMNAGWAVTFDLLINTPEYLSVGFMSSLIANAGRLCGLCDHRPTYGRFAVKSIGVVALDDGDSVSLS
jgi:hypothetical protein